MNNKELIIGIIIGLILGIVLTLVYLNLTEDKLSGVEYCDIQVPVCFNDPVLACSFSMPTTQKDCEEAGGIWAKKLTK